MVTRKGSDNLFPLLRFTHEDDTPATPPAGQSHLVVGVDKVLRYIDDDGVTVELGGGTSLPPGTDPGDILVWDGAAYDVLPIGADDTVPIADSGEALGIRWDTPPGGSSLPEYRPPASFAGAVAAASSVVPTFSSAPAQTSTLYAQIASVSSVQNVSSISQTNVTWTLVDNNANSTNSKVELWKGVPSGTPGTAVTVTFAGSTNGAAVITEWPSTYGLAGTADQVGKTTGSTTQPYGASITPTVGALVFALFGVSNGSIPMSLVAPDYVDCSPLVQLYGQSFYAFGYFWVAGPVGPAVNAYVPVCAGSAAWVGMMKSVV